jgi:hypothetical protein
MKTSIVPNSRHPTSRFRMSADTVVVGARCEDSGTTGVNSTPNESATDSGAAYVFVRSGGIWSQQAYLKASNTGESDEFGSSVAVSEDIVVVGACLECSGTTGVNSSPNESAFRSGSAYVFVRSGGIWSEQAYLKASNTGANDEFGSSVAVSADTVVVGAPYEGSDTTGVNSTPNEDASCAGAAYIFPPEPEIAVEQPAGTALVNNGAAVAFGTMPVGGVSKAKTFVIRNDGTALLTGIGVRQTGTHANDFLVSGPVGGELAVGASATFSVTFKPGAVGKRSATLMIASNDADENPFHINLAGIGALPAPEIVVEQPKGSNMVDGKAKKSFGTVKIGRAGAARTFTIRNIGTANLTGLAVSKSGAQVKEFIATSPAKTSLTPGASTTFKVTFRPVAKGTRKATIHIKSNDANETSFDIKLTGLGAEP